MRILFVILLFAAPAFAQTFELGLRARRDGDTNAQFVQWELDTISVEAAISTPTRTVGTVAIDPFFTAGIGHFSADAWPRIGDRIFRGQGVIGSLGAGVWVDPCDACGIFTSFRYQRRHVFRSTSFDLPTAGGEQPRSRIWWDTDELEGRIGYERRVTPFAGARWTSGDVSVRADNFDAPIAVDRVEVLAGVDVPLGRSWTASVEVAHDSGQTRPTVTLRRLFGTPPAPRTSDSGQAPLDLTGIVVRNGMLVFDSQERFERTLAQLAGGARAEELEQRLSHPSLRAEIAKQQEALEATGSLGQYNDPDNHFVADEALRTLLNRRGEVQVGSATYALWDSALTLQFPVGTEALLERLRSGESPHAVVKAGANAAAPGGAGGASGCKTGFSVTVINEKYQFSADAGGASPITYFWDFGDSTQSSEENPTHQYSSAGPFKVCLTVYDADGCSATACRWVSAQTCYAHFSAAVDDHTATFTAGATTSGFTKHWDFGDGTTSTEEQPKHEFAAGDYNVCLTITGPGGCKDTYCDWVTIKQPVGDCCDANDRVVNKWTDYASGTRRFKSVLWMRQIPWISHAWGARTVHYAKNSNGNWRPAAAEEVGVTGAGIIYFANEKGDRCATAAATNNYDTGLRIASIRVPTGGKFWAKSRSLKTRHWARHSGQYVYGPLLSLSSDCARKECKTACTEAAEECKDVCVQEADQCKDVCTAARQVCSQSCSGGWLKKLFCKLSCRWESGSCKRECRKGKRECKRECRKTKRECKKDC